MKRFITHEEAGFIKVALDHFGETGPAHVQVADYSGSYPDDAPKAYPLWSKVEGLKRVRQFLDDDCGSYKDMVKNFLLCQMDDIDDHASMFAALEMGLNYIRYKAWIRAMENDNNNSTSTDNPWWPDNNKILESLKWGTLIKFDYVTSSKELIVVEDVFTAYDARRDDEVFTTKNGALNFNVHDIIGIIHYEDTKTLLDVVEALGFRDFNNFMIEHVSRNPNLEEIRRTLNAHVDNIFKSPPRVNSGNTERELLTGAGITRANFPIEETIKYIMAVGEFLLTKTILSIPED